MVRDSRREGYVMKVSGLLGVMVGAVMLCLAPTGAAAAGKYDGSTPLLCVPVIVSECRPDGQCRQVGAESVNLTPFLKVDVKERKVYSEETGRASPISGFERLDGNMVVQGAQNGRGWTMTIAEETGKMSAAISSGAEGWIVFGSCTVVP